MLTAAVVEENTDDEYNITHPPVHTSTQPLPQPEAVVGSGFKERELSV